MEYQELHADFQPHLAAQREPVKPHMCSSNFCPFENYPYLLSDNFLRQLLYPRSYPYNYKA